jgi:hypothetical protein
MTVGVWIRARDVRFGVREAEAGKLRMLPPQMTNAVPRPLLA